MLLFNSYDPDPRVMKEARSLRQQGYEVEIIAWNRKGKQPRIQRTDAGLIVQIGPVLRQDFDRLSIITRTILKAKAMVAFGRQAGRLANQWRPDIVHAHDLDTLFLAVQVKAKSRAHLVYDSHEDYPAMIELRLGRIVGRLISEFEKRLLRWVDRIIADNETRAKRFSRDDIWIVMNVNEIKDEKLAGPTLDLPDHPVVIYAGGLEPGRGLEQWIEAKKYLKHHVTYVILGDGELGPAMEQRCKDLGLSDVYFTGRFDYRDLSRLLQQGDIAINLNHALPNNISGTPGKMFEYMACGLPVISSDLPAMARIIKDENAGIIVDGTDPVSIAAGITRLVENPGEAVEMGANGKRAVLRRYNWSKMEKVLIDLYSGLQRGR